MCGIVGFSDKTGGHTKPPAGRCSDDARGPGLPRARQRRRRLIGPRAGASGRRCLDRSESPARRATLRSACSRWAGSSRCPTAPLGRRAKRCVLDSAPAPGCRAGDLERALGARRGGLEVLSLGRRLDLVKQVGSPPQLEAAYGVSTWTGPLAIGHTRMSTESRIDSQPLAAVLGSRSARPGDRSQRPRDQLPSTSPPLRTARRRSSTPTMIRKSSASICATAWSRGEPFPRPWKTRSPTSTARSTTWSPRRRAWESSATASGSNRLMLAETDDFVAVATEEIALRRALPGDLSAFEPPPGSAIFYPIVAGASDA